MLTAFVRRKEAMMIEAVLSRRSIRKFLNTPISAEDITDIIQSGIKAPSAKNRQPWRFVVVQGREKAQMLRAFRQGLLREAGEGALLPQSSRHLDGARFTADIMETAPAVVFVINAQGSSIAPEMSFEEHVYEICNIQSVSAAIQNMLLTATDKGIGSLWICDIFFAYPELCRWLDCGGQLLAAVAFGYPAESPRPRPRKGMEDVVTWRI